MCIAVHVYMHHMRESQKFAASHIDFGVRIVPQLSRWLQHSTFNIHTYLLLATEVCMCSLCKLSISCYPASRYSLLLVVLFSLPSADSYIPSSAIFGFLRDFMLCCFHFKLFNTTFLIKILFNYTNNNNNDNAASEKHSHLPFVLARPCVVWTATLYTMPLLCVAVCVVAWKCYVLCVCSAKYFNFLPFHYANTLTRSHKFISFQTLTRTVTLHKVKYKKPSAIADEANWNSHW